jgi:hypothetical protein
MERRRKGARAATPGGVAPVRLGPTAAAPPTSGQGALAHIEAVIDAGGQILLGTIAPVHGAAVAHDGGKTLAMLRRRPNESATSLLHRLDAAIATAQQTGSRVDEINDPTGDEHFAIASPTLGSAVNTARR